MLGDSKSNDRSISPLTATRTRLLKNQSHFSQLRSAALDASSVKGVTHTFYRYPARFSPVFARAAIKAYSTHDSVVLDPFMGGGTIIVEAMLAGRKVIGSDINQLALFVTQSKTTILSTKEQQSLTCWAKEIVPTLRCNQVESQCDWTPRNMTLPKIRWLRKTISLLVASIESELKNESERRFARCSVLNAGQWALNGSKQTPTANDFRQRVTKTAMSMLAGMSAMASSIDSLESTNRRPLLRENDATYLDLDPQIIEAGPVDLVVTSPPYPGIHILYHRWQVDGRKETDAPYWIAACSDGQGQAFYNFAGRKSRHAEERYFEKAAQCFSSIRNVMRHHGILVQMISFPEPRRQLARYLRMLEKAGFKELREHGQRRIWRNVPGRRWHATFKGDLASSHEVVLVHRAV